MYLEVCAKEQKNGQSAKWCSLIDKDNSLLFNKSCCAARHPRNNRRHAVIPACPGIRLVSLQPSS